MSGLLRGSSAPTLADRVIITTAYQDFNRGIERQPALQSDWLSFVSRPWVQGPLDATLGNTQFATMMVQHTELKVDAESLVSTIDTALTQGQHMPWLLHVVQHVAGHPGMYVIMQAVEEMLGPHHIARLERLAYAALTRPRAAKVLAVLLGLITPQVVDDCMKLLQALLSDERLTRLMDAAEYVVSDDDRMTLAALALDSLSDAISDDAILHLIATIDAEADVELLVQTGHELLEVLLQDPVARGRHVGGFVDVVTDLKRLERTVVRNDEVMTLERIAVLHRVMAQISPACSQRNIADAAAWLRHALTSRRAHSWLSAVSSAISAKDVTIWWQAFDESLMTHHIQAALDALEAMLEGGRVWALLGQPQPMLEMLLLADEEARAATCRMRCGSHGSTASAASMHCQVAAAAPASTSSCTAGLQRPTHTAARAATCHADKGDCSASLYSRDSWILSSVASIDDIGTASTSSTAGSMAAAAAAALAAASAAAEAAASAPACALDDEDCHECRSRCADAVERAFALSAPLSDPRLASLIRSALQGIRPSRLEKQRAAAEVNAQHAITAAVAACAFSGSSHEVAGSSSGSSSSSGSLDGILYNSSGGSHIPASVAAGRLLPSQQSGQSLTQASTNVASQSNAQLNAGTAAAAALAVAAAVSASQMSSCSFASRHPAAASTAAAASERLALLNPRKGSSSIGVSRHVSAIKAGHVEEQDARADVGNMACLMRAVFKSCCLRPFFNLAAELLSPQRVATAMAVLDSALHIGEHSVAVGPVCELDVPPSSSDRSRAWLAAAWAALAAVPQLMSQKHLDAAVRAAADMAAAQSSRQLVLHAADTLLAVTAVQQELLFVEQQQQQQQHMQNGTYAPILTASGGASHYYAVLQSVMGGHTPFAPAHTACSSLEESSSNGSSSTGIYCRNGKLQLYATLLGLHVSLAKDLWHLWWAYHKRVALTWHQGSIALSPGAPGTPLAGPSKV